MYNLAIMYENGYGVIPVSCHKAVQFYKTVAEKGTWNSILQEAYEKYQQGDYAGALLRYERFAEQGYELAQSNVGWMYDKKLLGTLEKDFSQEYRQKRAFENYRNSAEQNNAYSLLKLGDYYFYGEGTHQNMEKSALYYQTSTDLRNPQAMFNLGYMHQVFLIIFYFF